MCMCVYIYIYIYIYMWHGPLGSIWQSGVVLYSNCNKTTGSGLFKQQLMVVSGMSPTKTTAPRG